MRFRETNSGRQLENSCRTLRLAVARSSDVAPSEVRKRSARCRWRPFTLRTWRRGHGDGGDLRGDVNVHDARYVALTGSLGAPLVTADDRLRRADVPRCDVLGPEVAIAGR